MKRLNTSYLLSVLVGALLTGFAWRVRGTGGWGSAWGLLNVGMLLTLYLLAVRGKRDGVSLSLVSFTAASFMFTAPAWGTLNSQITGLMKVDYAAGEQIVFIPPVSGVILMLCMGFGLAAVFSVMLGRCFSGQAWRLRDYAAVLAVFLLVSYGAKASVAHPLVGWLQPQTVEAFRNGLAENGISQSTFEAYLSHFNAEGWAKKIAGGRHYYACVSAFSSALGSLASIAATKFLVKDRYAARIGLTVCSAFAVAITVADLFFWFDNGGYHGTQPFTLPDGWAAWSLWEYFTGFIAGGVISAVVLKTAPDVPSAEPLLQKMPPKALLLFRYLLIWVWLIGFNAVRPLQRRLDEDTVVMIIGIAVGVIAVVAVSLLLRKKCGWALEHVPMPLLAPSLCGAFVLYDTFVCFFVSTDEPAVYSIGELHNVLVLLSCAAVTAYCAVLLRRNYISTNKKGSIS